MRGGKERKKHKAAASQTPFIIKRSTTVNVTFNLSVEAWNMLLKANLCLAELRLVSFMHDTNNEPFKSNA